jgi:hypothetical protein
MRCGMDNAMTMEAKIVTGLGPDRTAIVETRTIDSLLDVLCRRAHRLVGDPEVCERLRPSFRQFVRNMVGYFEERGELDEYLLTNIMAALATADNHGPGGHDVEDYSTFIRRLNPTDPASDSYFIIGREGRVGDPGCPLHGMGRPGRALAQAPEGKLHVFVAFYHARSRDVSRAAPRIPVEVFRRLVPEEIASDPELECAFLDVCFSDGAWELYQLKLAA